MSTDERVTIERPDDETIEIYVDGQLVASANHDEHGWSGMDAVEATALAVSRALAKSPATEQITMKTSLRVERPGQVVTWEGVLPLLPEGHLVTLPEVAAARIVVSMVHLKADGSSVQRLVCR